MVVVALLLVGSVFAIAVSEVIANKQLPSRAKFKCIIYGPSRSTPRQHQVKRFNVANANATPTPSASPTVDPAVVLDDIIKHRRKARQIEKKARKARAELCKRRAAFGMSMPLKLKGRKDFATWKETKLYFRFDLRIFERKTASCGRRWSSTVVKDLLVGFHCCATAVCQKVVVARHQGDAGRVTW